MGIRAIISNRSRSSVILVFFIAALAVYHVAVMLYTSSQPRYYYEYTRPQPREFEFPYFAVSISIALLVLEGVLLAFVLTGKFARIWIRALLCSFALLPFAAFGFV